MDQTHDGNFNWFHGTQIRGVVTIEETRHAWNVPKLENKKVDTGQRMVVCTLLASRGLPRTIFGAKEHWLA